MAFSVRPADIIKARVIDYLIEKYDGVVIGNEVMYGTSRKIVDLLALYRGETYAIEIKSSNDDLRRLPTQITEYSKIFDHTLVFATTDHMQKIKEIAITKVAIFEINTQEIHEMKTWSKTNKTLKREMLATMNSLFIRKTLNISNGGDSDYIRRRAMRHSKDEIRSILFDYFMEKLLNPYQIFLEERGERTEIDDILILSNRLNVE